MEQTIINLIVAPTGAGAIVALIMGTIKSNWKPDTKGLYWIPAIFISALFAIGILWYLEFFNVWIFLIATGLISSFQLLTQNEAWPAIKAIVLVVFKRLMKK
jgi:hypothetical protein